VTVETIYHCTITLTDTVRVYIQPIAEFIAHPWVTDTWSPTINFYDESIDAMTWFWNFGDPGSWDLNYSDLAYPYHNYSDSGTYPVMLIVTNGSCADTVIHNVVIHEGYAFFIPNAFTPTGNGLNDIFNGFGVGFQTDKFELTIFDRWGELIFHTTDSEQGWDGRMEGKDEICMEGIYV
jgi:gliding motility-associated-like protein